MAQLRTPILTEKVKDLHLQADRKYPTEMMQAIRDATDTRQMIQAWRRAQEKVTLRGVK